MCVADSVLATQDSRLPTLNSPHGTDLDYQYPVDSLSMVRKQQVGYSIQSPVNYWGINYAITMRAVCAALVLQNTNVCSQKF